MISFPGGSTEAEAGRNGRFYETIKIEKEIRARSSESNYRNWPAGTASLRLVGVTGQYSAHGKRWLVAMICQEK